jgi:hypothetical protein
VARNLTTGKVVEYDKPNNPKAPYLDFGPEKAVEFRSAFEELNQAKASHLIIFGHGDEGSSKVGLMAPAELAEFLALRCRLTKVSKISLIACHGAATEVGKAPATNSFAREFHYILGDRYEIRTTLTARTGIMNTLQEFGVIPKSAIDVSHLTPDQQAKLRPGSRIVWYPSEPGARPSSGNGTWRYKGAGSKYIWTWEHKIQIEKPAYG